MNYEISKETLDKVLNYLALRRHTYNNVAPLIHELSKCKPIPKETKQKK